MTTPIHSRFRIVIDPEHEPILGPLYQSKVSAQFTSDSGFDLYLPADVTIGPYETTLIHLGIRAEYIVDNAYAGYQLYPRSSISKTKIRLANSVGIIDPHYRGYLMAAVDNIGPTPQVLKQGERYFQLVFVHLDKPDTFEVVEELSVTDRGNGGFGSTGK
jgi:dUTP pyrophosphatase